MPAARDAPINNLRPLVWAAWTLVALGAVALLHAARDFFIPLLVGITLAYMLRPAVEVLAGLRLPRVIAALVVVIAAGGLAGCGIYTLAGDAVQLLETLPKAARTLRLALQEGRAERPTAITNVNEAARELDTAAAAAAGRPAAPPAPAPSLGNRLQEYVVAKGQSFLGLLVQVLFALLLAWYVLSEGDTFRTKILRVVSPSLASRATTVRILEDINRQLQRHMLAIFVTNGLVGVATAIAFTILGVEQAVLWGVISGVLHFVPYAGQAIVTVASTAAAYLQSGSAGYAAAVAATTLTISLTIGTVLATWLLSRASRANTTVLFVAMLFFGWLWGAWGLVLASPVVAIIKSVCDFVLPFAPAAEFLSGRDPARTPSRAARVPAGE
jgi:predicted PurR-regulated permease PerM